ncbi:MAG TPA: hypothetical protein VLY04_04170 [Bryobacteraceae bacterium]|nr:hypothetical protein [Bryobacteraceae bacterium]
MRYGHFVLLCAVVLVMSLPIAAQPVCTQEMIRGTWVDSVQGFFFINVPGSSQPVPAPMGGLGIFSIDSHGDFTAVSTGSVAGQIAAGKVAGTIQVSPDCTAKATFTMEVPGMLPPTPGVETMVILDHGNEMWSMPTKDPLGPSVGVETLRRISLGEAYCFNNAVVGTFGVTYQGYAMTAVPGQSQPVPVPISYVGNATVDSKGKLTGGGTYSVGGTIENVTLANATIQIKPDCTGIMEYRIVPLGSNQPLPGQGSDQFVAFENRDEIILMTAQGVFGGPVMLGSMKRIEKSSWDDRMPNP